MNWLEAVKKKLSGATKSRRGQRRAAWDPERTWLGLKWLGLAAVAIGVVAGWGPAERHLGGYVGVQRGRFISAKQVRLVEAPRWMPAGMKARLQELVAEQVGRNPLDGSGLVIAARTLASSGWVEEMGSVRRVPGGVEVRATYRQPVAAVERLDGYRLVDGRGATLPGVYRMDELSKTGLPMIVGVRSLPGKTGEAWPGKEVGSALGLLKLLTGRPYEEEVRAVAVSRWDRNGPLRLTLLTRQRGGMVRWGLPPGEEDSIEPAAKVKLRWLEELQYQRGSIDAGGRVVEVSGPAVLIHDTEEGVDVVSPLAEYSSLR